MKFRSVSFRYNYRDDDACNIFYSCINLAHVKSDDENYRTLWIMTTKMHSTAKILKFTTLPLISAIFIDIYYQSLRMVGASVGYLLKPPSVDLNRRQNIWIKCKKRCILLCPYDPSCPSVFMATSLNRIDRTLALHWELLRSLTVM